MWSEYFLCKHVKSKSCPLTKRTKFKYSVLKISVSNTKLSSFPARKLTKVGGEFPSWNKNSKSINWSIGNSFLTYNLDAAVQFDNIQD